MRTTTLLALFFSAILCAPAAADNGVTVHTSSINTPEGYILMDDDPAPPPSQPKAAWARRGGKAIS